MMNLLYGFVGLFFKLTKEQQQLLQQNKPFMLQVTAHSCEPFGLMPAFAVHGPLVWGGQDMKWLQESITGFQLRKFSQETC